VRKHSYSLMQNRFTWALKLEGSGWLIIHEHTSTPISSNDTKAIFHREKAA
jgi:ketosteroid isomerase-like protein